MEFINPSKGKLSLEAVAEDLLAFIGQAPASEHRIIIGSDSQNRGSSHTTTFVTAIIVHRIGKGARYYFHRRTRPMIQNLRQRMFTEASMSLMVCGELRNLCQDSPAHEDLQHLEVHLDVGQNGATQVLIQDLVGWVVGSGYEAKIKPDSFVASKVADRYTRI